MPPFHGMLGSVAATVSVTGSSKSRLVGWPQVQQLKWKRAKRGDLIVAATPFVSMKPPGSVGCARAACKNCVEPAGKEDASGSTPDKANRPFASSVHGETVSAEVRPRQIEP